MYNIHICMPNLFFFMTQVPINVVSSQHYFPKVCKTSTHSGICILADKCKVQLLQKKHAFDSQ